MNRPPAEGPTADCLDADTLAALAEGALDQATRTSVLPHVAGCEYCRGAVASVARMLADADVAKAMRTPPAAPLRWIRIALPAVAAAALVVLVVGPGGLLDRPGADRHRAPTIANGTLPRSLSPAGPVDQATALRWAVVQGADRYRVTLFDDSGRVVYETETVEAAVPLPDSVGLAPERRYLWKVEARVGFDRWISSEFVEFVLTRGTAR